MVIFNPRNLGLVILCPWLLGFAGHALSANPSSPGAQTGVDSELASLLGTLEDVTELATKTRMNADFVPGILSVLHGDEMVALGVHTVWEALELVPGVQITRNNTGEMRVSIRGTQHGNGNVKVLLNSVTMNKAYSGYANVFHIPVEQVERIEVIRGPGSAVHGEFAFAGVIDIITRKDGNRVHGRIGSGDTYGGGGVFSLADAQRDLHFSLNLAGWDTPGADVTAGPDLLHLAGQGAVSHAPGASSNAEDSRLAILSLDYREFSLLAQYSRDRRGQHFGVLNALPEPSDEKTGTPGEQWSLQARQGLRFSTGLDAELKLSWMQTQSDSGVAEWLPPGAFLPTLPGIIFPDGMLQQNHFQESRWEVGLGLDWTGWTNHRVRLDLSVAQARIDDAWWAGNYDPLTYSVLPELRRYEGELNFIQEGATRRIHSLALQDQYRFSDRLELTAGLRYDHYSDVGDNLSPRLAAVWRVAEGHVLKLQYAEAFFPPNLYQVYGARPPGFDFPSNPETIATTELGYIFRRADTVARATLFYSELEDLIVFENGAFVNRGQVRLQGIETEWEQRLGRDWKIAANLSYTDTLDKQTDGPLAGAADWLGNLSLSYRMHPDLLLTGRWRHVGDRHRAANDPRQDMLDGYDDLSLTINWFDAGTPGLTLRGGVGNLLNEEIKSPAPAFSYLEDYPTLQDRRWWAQVSYQFQ